MSKSQIEEKVENYFTSINSMARRIMIDSNTAKQTIGEKWEKLNYEEQCNLIMSEFIKPVVLEKYTLYPTEINSFPKLSICGGEKYVFDDEHGNSKGTGYSWRDEHSAPFLWETQSQLDIRFSDGEISEAKQDFIEHDPDQQSDVPQESKKENNPIVQPVEEQPQVETKCSADTEVDVPVSKPLKIKKKSVLLQEKLPEDIHPKIIHRKDIHTEDIHPKETNIVINNDGNSAESLTDLNVSVDMESPSKGADIPKTGFDFLDNW